MAKVDVAAIRTKEILDAAFKVFSEKGYHDAGIADIAAELKIGHGTIYRYFKNKADIASCVIDTMVNEMAVILSEFPPSAVNTPEQNREQLKAIWNRTFDILDERPYLLKWLSYESLGIDETVSQRIAEAFELFASYTESYLRNGIEKGILKSGFDTRKASYAINAMLFEAGKRLATAEDAEEDRREWFDTLINLALDGLAARPPGIDRADPAR